MRVRHGVWMAGAVLWAMAASLGCGHAPQELPVVVSPQPDGARLQWRDAQGPLRGEVPWVLRTDVLGSDTFLVVETAAGEVCAQRVSFRVLAAGTTEYDVSLVSDLHGTVSWRVGYGEDKHLKLFTCEPRPAADPPKECIKGGIPKPLFGGLMGGFSAELAGGGPAGDIQAVRFERGFPCGVGQTPGATDSAP